MNKRETFYLKDLEVKGEGNLHLIVVNKKTFHVLRLKKHDFETTAKPYDDEEINYTKLYKLPVGYKKYTILQKYWGKTYLPKTRIAMIPGQIIEQIAKHLEEDRQECRRHRSVVTKTSYIEIQPDVTRIPMELVESTTGSTYCFELKLKHGIMRKPENGRATDARDFIPKFCMKQLLESEETKTNYCPADLFSGEYQRMVRALKALLDKPMEKLRIFENGRIWNSFQPHEITRMMEELSGSSSKDSDSASVDAMCDLLIRALTLDVTQKFQYVSVPFSGHTHCRVHSQANQTVSSGSGDKQSIAVFEDSVLGRVIKTSSLVPQRVEEVHEMYQQLEKFLDQNKIEKNECIFDLWTEKLMPLDLPSNIKRIIRTIMKFVTCITVRDCSVMIRITKLSDPEVDLKKYGELGSAVLTQPDGQKLLIMISVIDIGLKPLDKLKQNMLQERKLVAAIPTHLAV